HRWASVSDLFFDTGIQCTYGIGLVKRFLFAESGCTNHKDDKEMNCLMFVLMLCAQECLTIHQQNTANSLKIEELDSLTFSTERAEMKLHTTFGAYPFSFAAVDSLSFSGIDDTVRIDFDGSRVSVRNPF